MVNKTTAWKLLVALQIKGSWYSLAEKGEGSLVLLKGKPRTLRQEWEPDGWEATYELVQGPQGVECPCPSFKHRGGSCKHLGALLGLLETLKRGLGEGSEELPEVKAPVAR